MGKIQAFNIKKKYLPANIQSYQKHVTRFRTNVDKYVQPIEINYSDTRLLMITVMYWFSAHLELLDGYNETSRFYALRLVCQSRDISSKIHLFLHIIIAEPILI